MAWTFVNGIYTSRDLNYLVSRSIKRFSSDCKMFFPYFICFYHLLMWTFSSDSFGLHFLLACKRTKRVVACHGMEKTFHFTYHTSYYYMAESQILLKLYLSVYLVFKKKSKHLQNNFEIKTFVRCDFSMLSATF